MKTIWKNIRIQLSLTVLKIEILTGESDNFKKVVRIKFLGKDKCTFHSTRTDQDDVDLFLIENYPKVEKLKNEIIAEQLDTWVKILHAYLSVKAPRFLRLLGIKKPMFLN